MIAVSLKCSNVSAFLIARSLSLHVMPLEKVSRLGSVLCGDVRQGRMYIPVEYPMEYKCMSYISGTISYHKVSAIELWKSTVRKLKIHDTANPLNYLCTFVIVH